MNTFGQHSIDLRYPEGVKPNLMFWSRAGNLWRSRNKFFRRDNSVAWRRSYVDGVSRGPGRSMTLSDLVPRTKVPGRLRFLVLGDPGEGDQSQYALVPVIRALRPDWMIVNGDVAYPAGSRDDFLPGFFRPYQSLEIPIWAVPGNHEYYSQDKGRTFFDTFCTFNEKPRWDRHGLILVPQPGTYWEVEEDASIAPGGRRPLTILGLDSGMKGHLDGVDRWQLDWLRERLRRADAALAPGRSVMVLFHIPAMVDERHDEGTRLDELHAILAASPSVGLVVCGHIHNHQVYAPETFRSYLSHRGHAGNGTARSPHYVVAGGGGAYLSRPARRGAHPASFVFPSMDDWRIHAGRAQKSVAGLGLGRSAAGRIAGLANASLRSDDDSGRYLSLLVVDVTPGSVEARHLLMPDLAALYPRRASVDIAAGTPPIAPARIDVLLADDPRIGKQVMRL